MQSKRYTGTQIANKELGPREVESRMSSSDLEKQDETNKTLKIVKPKVEISMSISFTLREKEKGTIIFWS